MIDPIRLRTSSRYMSSFYLIITCFHHQNTSTFNDALMKLISIAWFILHNLTFYSDMLYSISRYIDPHCYTPVFVLCSLLFSELKLHLYTKHDSQIQAFYSRHLYLDVDHYSIVILQNLCTICWTSLLSVILYVFTCALASLSAKY